MPDAEFLTLNCSGRWSSSFWGSTCRTKMGTHWRQACGALPGGLAKILSGSACEKGSCAPQGASCVPCSNAAECLSQKPFASEMLFSNAFKVLPQRRSVWGSNFIERGTWSKLSTDPHLQSDRVWFADQSFGTMFPLFCFHRR